MHDGAPSQIAIYIAGFYSRWFLIWLAWRIYVVRTEIEEPMKQIYKENTVKIKSIRGKVGGTYKYFHEWHVRKKCWLCKYFDYQKYFHFGWAILNFKILQMAINVSVCIDTTLLEKLREAFNIEATIWYIVDQSFYRWRYFHDTWFNSLKVVWKSESFFFNSEARRAKLCVSTRWIRIYRSTKI